MIMLRNRFYYVLALAAVLLLCWTLTARADEAASGNVVVKSDADVAGDLGILQGDGSGLTADYLSKSTTRLQAAILYLRLKGLESEALTFKGMDSFSDSSSVSDNNKKVLAYLKANPALGWTGTGDDKFDPLSTITSQQFYKVLLESLGYKQGTDFEFTGTLAFASQKGLSKAAAVDAFRNRDIATAIVEALSAKPKGSDKTLLTTLVDLKKIDAGKAEALKYTSIEYRKNDASGSYLADVAGKALYYFTKDAVDPNSCTGNCLINWPIFYADHLKVPADLNAADFGVLTRADGKLQTTFKGWPLYYYVKDEKAGDVKGEGSGGVWYTFKNYSVTIGTKADLGNFFTDGKGMTLYYFDTDTPGISTCSGKCIDNWPVFYGGDSLVVPTGLKASDFGTLIRADGTKQTLYKGYPLYYWASDKKRGDTTGQNVGKVWFVIDPAAFTGTKAVNTSIKTAKSDKLGTYLVDSKGMALYLYTLDAVDMNSCKGDCIKAWPIFYDTNLTVSSDLSKDDFGILVRDDGTKQTTYKGWPVYYFINDKNPGETKGENVGKVWFVFKNPFYNVTIATKKEIGGNYLVDANGMALYYYDKDTPGVSNCSGKCIQNWPAFDSGDKFVVPTGVNTSDFGTITREDGTKQTTYKGYPLYYWVGDKKMGDTTGQNVNQVWFVVDPVKFSGTTAAN